MKRIVTFGVKSGINVHDKAKQQGKQDSFERKLILVRGINSTTL